MKKYEPSAMVKDSRYAAYFPTLDATVQQAALDRIAELVEAERQWCDKGNYEHMCNMLTALALYEVLQQHGLSEEEAYASVSTNMWAALRPEGMQRLARRSFFLPLMRRVVPFGFKHKSGAGWRYTWFENEPKNEFHFECNECLYQRIFKKYGVLERLGPMFCHSDIINYGNLPYTDFIRTKTLCQGGDVCDFFFRRYETDAGDGWERTKSI